MQNLMGMNAVELISVFDETWARLHISPAMLERVGKYQQGEDESAGADAEAIDGLAGVLMSLFTTMVEERRCVQNDHPWRFGALLLWLIGKAFDGETEMTRFEALQKAGCWTGQSFREWADETTGVKYGAWMNWVNNVRVLHSPAGQKVIEMAGLESEEEFIELVPSGKMTRVAATIAAGRIEEHHVDALTDPVVSESGLRHALRTPKDKWEEEQVKQAEEAERWVNQKGPRHWLDHDLLRGTVYLKSVDADGVLSQSLLARLPEPATDLVALIQKTMMEAADKAVKHLQPGGEELAHAFFGKVGAEQAEEAG